MGLWDKIGEHKGNRNDPYLTDVPGTYLLKVVKLQQVQNHKKKDVFIATFLILEADLDGDAESLTHKPGKRVSWGICPDNSEYPDSAKGNIADFMRYCLSARADMEGEERPMDALDFPLDEETAEGMVGEDNPMMGTVLIGMVTTITKKDGSPYNKVGWDVHPDVNEIVKAFESMKDE